MFQIEQKFGELSRTHCPPPQSYLEQRTMKRSRTSTKRKIADDDTHPKEEAVKQQKTGEVNAEETHLAALPERSEPSLPEKPIENETYTACPYLDTVNRSMLNFDFEKKCSVSLLTTNIYCCLVCGKYYQGRTPNTHAYTHSLEEDHHVFINMNNRRIFCLPDDYEVFDASLLDIKHNVNPTLTPVEVALLDTKEMVSRTLDNRNAVCGVTGLNNLHAGDAANAILQCFIHLPKLRNYLLEFNTNTDNDHLVSDLVLQLKNLTRRVWNTMPWRSTISPHELLQEMSLRSDGKFGVGSNSDPLELYSWFMNTLQKDIATFQKKIGDKRASSTIISRLFQGTVEIRSEKVARRPTNGDTAVTSSNSMDLDDPSSNNQVDSAVNGGISTSSKADASDSTIRTTPFFFLQLDLPAVTLLKDEKSKSASLQVPIYNLLSKYDGKTAQFLPATKENRFYQIVTLPQYLVFFVKRFTQNMFLIEKNKTIVNFPVDELDMAEYTKDKETKGTKYALRAYICHTGDTVTGSCISRFYHRSNGKWYNCHDGTVDEMLAEDHFVAEAYLLFYERCL